ncbi:MAG: AmmeMemoRadiSam system protein B [Spirochaetales bacterium]|nr:AmmeMemoRadiSam system protein B [Spirochaetales bacterium]MCF7937871.1 AmmeMemoRadiSam system protein B [Spirochaetales bacterium]
MIEETVREPIVPGIFYPSDSEGLKTTVRRLLDNAETQKGKAAGLILPHAGYDYAGTQYGEGFRAVSSGSYKTAVLLAPVHREEEDILVLPESTSFLIPSGKIAVDQELVEELESAGTNFVRNDIPHLEEHAIEVHLPFLFHLFPKIRIVPILMGRASRKNVRVLSSALNLLCGKAPEEVLFVVSSNLSSSKSTEESDNQTQELIRLIREGDSQAVLDAGLRHEVSPCGLGPISVLLSCMNGPCRSEVLSTGNSQQLDGNREHVVSYGALAFFRDKDDET